MHIITVGRIITTGILSRSTDKLRNEKSRKEDPVSTNVHPVLAVAADADTALNGRAGAIKGPHPVMVAFYLCDLKRKKIAEKFIL